MFTRLQQKWKVNGWRLLLIIATFAIGGSLCGYAARKIMQVLPVEQPVLWTIVYIFIVTLTWPLSVFLVSIPLGQFSFFRSYLLKIGMRMSLIKSSNAVPGDTRRLPRIAIFASGTGTNAAAIISASQAENASFEVGLVVCNKPGAGVLAIASQNGIPSLVIEKDKFFRGNAYTSEMQNAGIDFIVLAGFLWKIPAMLIDAYRYRIINIHPALLPNYGGKGMYGQFVHEAVIASGDAESGITIHWVDEQYDHGSIIFQARCPVVAGDTAASLAARIHALEHKHYPQVVSQLMADIEHSN